MPVRTALLFVALSVLCCNASRLRLPSDVGNGKGGKHPCVAVMRETQQACSDLAHGEYNHDCSFATCYTAHLNRERCTDVVTDGTPKNVLFPDHLDKIKKKHGIKCKDGGIGGEGIRNAQFDCGKVPEDGLAPSLIERFVQQYPVSANSTGLNACVLPKK
eukprot:gnl/TRDRNA2_/TRDRNA2_188813_c0_seq1.p2 gnl/TRDRNA2_/TRDRNA2_188813_c0~~gnl/TRDRNA2_/TRDRNA2_188813_c0_seq1.p2  ORF type:complete len:160 (+),score=39.50 gnl/TRDRNA2_/TRDRNA2_188813_c0_seq1:83-562(+)